jgi:hypothetical protein
VNRAPHGAEKPFPLFGGEHPVPFHHQVGETAPKGFAVLLSRRASGQSHEDVRASRVGAESIDQPG